MHVLPVALDDSPLEPRCRLADPRSRIWPDPLSSPPIRNPPSFSVELLTPPVRNLPSETLSEHQHERFEMLSTAPNMSRSRMVPDTARPHFFYRSWIINPDITNVKTTIYCGEKDKKLKSEYSYKTVIHSSAHFLTRAHVHDY
jgi:hypothetical protein